jgi:hypothetical protein
MMTTLQPTIVAARARPDSGDQVSLVRHESMEVLGGAIVNRLFRVGLELCSAVGVTRDESVRLRLEQAVEELDAAVKDMRRLMLAVIEEPVDPGD